MPRLRIQVLAAAVFVLAWIQSTALGPKHESGVLPIDPPTPYVHYFGKAPTRGHVLAVHGLDVSKETIGLFSSALADGGFDVYAIDLPGHGDSKTGFQTDLAQQAISNAKRYLGEKIVVVGHSMGAGLLLDLAETEQFSTMVLLSPPPISIAEIHAERVLIATDRMIFPAFEGLCRSRPISEARTSKRGTCRGAVTPPSFIIPRMCGRLWNGLGETEPKPGRPLDWCGLF